MASYAGYHPQKTKWTICSRMLSSQAHIFTTETVTWKRGNERESKNHKESCAPSIIEKQLLDSNLSLFINVGNIFH